MTHKLTLDDLVTCAAVGLGSLIGGGLALLGGTAGAVTACVLGLAIILMARYGFPEPRGPVRPA